MKAITVTSVRRVAAFTLIEMIGVLSVLAILASMLLPRVFQAISSARINEAVASCNGARVAINQYYGRYTRLGGVNGSDLGLSSGGIFPNWDVACLIPEGCLERPFQSRIANSAQIRVVNIVGNIPDTPIADSADALERGAYNRNGTGAINDVIGSWIVEACLEGVDNQDAIELSLLLDGPTLTAAAGSSDEIGRVKYFFNPDTRTASVRVYLSHR